MKKYILIFLLTATGAHIAAQNDTINRMVLVESTYKPVVGNADKRNFLPEEVKPTMKKEEVIYLNDIAAVKPAGRHPIETPSYTIRQEEWMPGYVHFGYGNYNNLNGLASYRKQLGFNNTIGINAFLEGWTGNIRQTDNSKWRSTMHELGINADYAHSWDETSMEIAIGAERNIYNYRPQATDVSARQTSAHLWVRTQLKGTYDDLLSYHFVASLGRFGQDYWQGTKARNAENAIHLTASISANLEEWGKASLLIANSNLVYGGISNYKNYTSVQLTPKWEYQYGLWSFTTGLNLDFQNIKGAVVQASPECKISYVPTERFMIDFIIDGGRHLTSFVSLYALSPYWNTTKQLRSSYEYINAEVRGNVCLTDGMHLAVHGGYRYTGNDLLETPLSSEDIIYTGITNCNVNRAFVGANTTYTFADIFKVRGSADFFHCSSRSTSVASARTPQWDLCLDTQVRVLKNLRAQAGYRYIRFTDIMGDAVYAPISDLNIGAVYVLDKRWSFSINAHNLLNQRFEQYYGYASQGFNVIAGAAYKF